MNHCMTLATEEDAKEILSIYTPYVQNTAISYEYDVPTVEEFQNRIRKIQTKYPYLVYRVDSKIVGYAYAYAFKARAAFSWDAETSIYIHPEYHQKGVAKKLYEALIELLKLQGYYHIYAYISYPNDPSVRFHEKFGFSICAKYEKTGYKLGAWRDLICMELCLNKDNMLGHTAPKSCLPITALDPDTIKRILTINP